MLMASRHSSWRCGAKLECIVCFYTLLAKRAKTLLQIVNCQRILQTTYGHHVGFVTSLHAGVRWAKNFARAILVSGTSSWELDCELDNANEERPVLVTWWYDNKSLGRETIGKMQNFYHNFWWNIDNAKNSILQSCIAMWAVVTCIQQSIHNDIIIILDEDRTCILWLMFFHIISCVYECNQQQVV